MWWMINRAMWRRLLVLIAFWFFVTRIAKKRYMNQGMFDSHDAQMRESVAHM
jgi:hypothetical protein